MDETNLLHDSRIVERNIKKGLLAPKEYEKFLKGLEDLAEEAVRFRVEQPDTPQDGG